MLLQVSVHEGNRQTHAEEGSLRKRQPATLARKYGSIFWLWTASKRKKTIGRKKKSLCLSKCGPEKRVASPALLQGVVASGNCTKGAGTLERKSIFS